MATLAEFLHELFREGQIVLHGRPGDPEPERSSAVAVLAAEFMLHRLDVAGEPIPFDPDTAFWAADLLRRASWFLVNRSEPEEAVRRSLVPLRPPRTASEHLSADLTLRFLPAIYRRARSISPSDGLSTFLADLLRAWPLSGVLSDLAEGPAEVGDLGGHPGLWLLYGERLAIDEKPAWMVDGPARGYVELVFQGPGQGASFLARDDGGSTEGVASWLTRRSRSSEPTWWTTSSGGSSAAMRWST